MKPSLRTRSRGLTLIEMVAALSLLGVFLTVSAQLFHVSFKQMEGTAALDAQAAQFDHAMASLRRDVWASLQCTAHDRDLRLELPAGRQITWSAAEDGRLSRADGGDAAHWTHLPAITFETNGPMIAITAVTKSRAARLAMTAPALLPEARR